MHTPGPWNAFDVSELFADEPGGRAFAVGPREFCSIAHVRAGSTEALATGDIEANARLIAAAPDLYEFARECADDRDDRISPGLQVKARALLSKLSQQQGSDATGSPQAPVAPDSEAQSNA